MDNADYSKNPGESLSYLEEAQIQMKKRPKLSIVLRLTVAFLICFVISLGSALIIILTIHNVKNNYYFIETIHSYSLNLQKGRVYEKNYFLHQRNLADAIAYSSHAKEIHDSEKQSFVSFDDEDDYLTMKEHHEKYHQLLIRLSKKPFDASVELYEQEINQSATALSRYVDEFRHKGRESIHDRLTLLQVVPVVLSLLLAVFLMLLAIFITTQMLWSLQRKVAAAQRIAEGDLTPFVSTRKYYDEFSELSFALNEMIQQLASRQEMLIKFHKLRAIGTLTAGIEHELNNPLNNIVLTALMFKEDYRELDEEEKIEMLDGLVGESERTQKIVRNLLDYTRETELKTRSVSVETILENTLRLLNNQIRMNKVKVQHDAENLPSIHADQKQLTQVFINLILNALDAMPSGGTLRISAKSSALRDSIAVRFEDDGVGIPAEKLETIFDPFITTKKEGEGTGLGLSVCKSILENHGGTISVVSVLKQGSTFTVDLPTSMIPAKLDDHKADSWQKPSGVQ